MGLGRRTCNRQAAGSSPGRSASRYDPGQVVHTHTHEPLFTKQYKLVPVQARSSTGTPRDTLARGWHYGKQASCTENGVDFSQQILWRVKSSTTQYSSIKFIGADFLEAMV